MPGGDPQRMKNYRNISATPQNPRPLPRPPSCTALWTERKQCVKSIKRRGCRGRMKRCRLWIKMEARLCMKWLIQVLYWKHAFSMLWERSPYIHLKPYWVIPLLHTGRISISLWKVHRRRWGSQPALLVSFKASAVWVRKEGKPWEHKDAGWSLTASCWMEQGRWVFVSSLEPSVRCVNV